MSGKVIADSKNPRASSQPSSIRIRVSLLNAPLPKGEGQKLEVDHVQLGKIG